MKRQLALQSLLLALAAMASAPHARGSANPPGVTITIGANFHPLETWEPGKQRRWMSQNGDLFVLNETGRATSINLRFYAEAFHIPRDLRITADGKLLAQWAIEPRAHRYIVVKALGVEPGRHRIVFQSAQPPLAPAEVMKSTDRRPLSVALSPFSIIPAESAEAQQEWTAPFAAVPRVSSMFTPLENRANDFRREGRLLEAARVYEQALARGATDYSYLLYGLTLMALERRNEGVQVMAECVALRGAAPRRAWVRGLCEKAVAYLGESRILAEPERDPGRRARAIGKMYEAVEIYERLAAEDPDAVHAHYWLGILKALAERRVQARPHFERVIAVVGDSPDGRFLRSLKAYF